MDWQNKLTQSELDDLYIQDMRRNMEWAYRIGERKPHYPVPATILHWDHPLWQAHIHLWTKEQDKQADDYLEAWITYEHLKS